MSFLIPMLEVFRIDMQGELTLQGYTPCILRRWKK